MWIIGLTGAIGSGKSTIASCFRRLGIPVHCADAYVHSFFETERGVQQVKALWPDTFVNGKIDRQRLGSHVLFSPTALDQLEKILYPKLVEDQRKFIKKNQFLKKPIIVLDVPLLFEVGLDIYCNYVVVASISQSLQKLRVLRRKGMTLKKFQRLKFLQLKESERKKKEKFIIYTGRDKGNVLKSVQQILFILSQRPSPKWQGKWPKTLTRRSYESGNCSGYGNNRV